MSDIEKESENQADKHCVCGKILKRKRGRYCTESCRAKYATRRYRNAKGLYKPVDKTCKFCNNLFSGSSIKTFCNVKCKSKWTCLNKRDSMAEYSKEYRKKNKLAVNIRCNGRRKRNRIATPKWLTLFQIKEIETFYTHAKDCSVVTGEPYEVDHIVPISGKNVCGLHVPWNLQVLPREINRRKSASHGF